MTASPYLGLLTLAVFAGVIAAGVAAIIRTVKRQRELWRQARVDCGFIEAPDAVEPLTARMPALHQHWSSNHEVRSPWRKSEWGYELFLFDLRSSSGKSSKLERDQAMVTSKDLALPRFSLAPKVQGDGLVATLANRAIAWVASKFAARATFPEHPEFDSRYFVFGDDEAALRDYFDAGRVGRLAEIPFLQVAGNGDGFLFVHTPFKPVKKPDQEKLRDILQDARRLYEILKG